MAVCIFKTNTLVRLEGLPASTKSKRDKNSHKIREKTHTQAKANTRTTALGNRKIKTCNNSRTTNQKNATDTEYSEKGRQLGQDRLYV